MFEKYIERLVNCPRIYWSKESLERLPKCNGVYVFVKNDKFLYVGQSRNIYDRVYKHHWTGNNSNLLYNLKCLLSRTGQDDIFESYIAECYIQFVELEVGRAELEDYILDTIDPILNNFGFKIRKLDEYID